MGCLPACRHPPCLQARAPYCGESVKPSERAERGRSAVAEAGRGLRGRRRAGESGRAGGPGLRAMDEADAQHGARARPQGPAVTGP